MSRSTHVLLAVSSFILVTALTLLACAGPSTLTETITEAQLNEELAGQGFVVDLQPGKLVMTGDIEGMAVAMEMTMAESDGGLRIELTSVTVDGESMPLEMFADISDELSQTIYSEDEGYAVDSVTITDTEITIVSSRTE